MKRSLSTGQTLAVISGLSLLSLAAASVAAAEAPSAPVSQAMIDAAARDSQNFLHTNGNYDQTRYYPAAQITRANVKKLRPAWIFQTEIVESMETTPIVVERRDVRHHLVQSCVCARCPDRRAAVALQAQHGPDHDLSVAAPTIAASSPTVTSSTWARSMPSWSRWMPRPASRCGRQQIADPELGYSETMAPTVVDGKVLIGTNGGEYGIRGFVKAYDADSGKLLWTFNTIPGKVSGRVGHQGRHRTRHESRHQGGKSAAQEDRGSVQNARRRRVAEHGGRREDRHRVVRRRQPLARPVRRDAAGRQPLHQLAGRGGPRDRQVQVPLPVHRARRLGSRRGQPGHPRRRQGQGRQDGPGVLHAGKTGHVYVHDARTAA